MTGVPSHGITYPRYTKHRKQEPRRPAYNRRQEGEKMIHNIPRDYNRPLKEQIKEGTAQGWLYIGCFGRTGDAVLKFVEGR